MIHHLKSIFYMAIAGALFWLFLPEKYTFDLPIKFANSVSSEETISRLTTDDRFNISIFAENIPNARALAITETGDVIVSIPNEGVLKLIYNDANQDNVSDGIKLLLKDLNRPHGIILLKRTLFCVFNTTPKNVNSLGRLITLLEIAFLVVAVILLEP